MTSVFRHVLVVSLAALAALTPAKPSAAAAPGFPLPLVFSQRGDILFTTATETTKITTDGGNSWPRLSPDHREVAYLHNDDVWIADVTDLAHVSTQQISHGEKAGGPSWSPHGDYLAYRSGTANDGTLFLVRVHSPQTTAVKTYHHGAKLGVPAGEWSPLRDANTVAWSPDGTSIAFPGGDCWAIYDDCLTVLTLATNAERTIAAFGHGDTMSGFATTPAWSADSHRIYYTSQVANRATGLPGPVKSLGYDLVHKNVWQVGLDGDSTPVPIRDGRFLVSAEFENYPWAYYLDGHGGRVGLIPGAQPDWHR